MHDESKEVEVSEEVKSAGEAADIEGDVSDDDSVPPVVHGFKVGDIVKKKSGSAPMTVLSISQEGVATLSWSTQNGASVEEHANADELELAADGLVAAAEKLSGEPDVVEGAGPGVEPSNEDEEELPEESPNGVQVTPPEADASEHASDEEAK